MAIQLTTVERLILANQFRILEHLDQSEDWARLRKIVEEGYALQYDDLSREVWDILNMFSMMKRAYENLPPEERKEIQEYVVRFSGFDGNNEPERVRYTRFIVDDLGRFSDLDRGDDFNSHMPSLATYRRMLPAWEASDDRHNLSKEDLMRIAEEWKHPDNR